VSDNVRDVHALMVAALGEKVLEHFFVAETPQGDLIVLSHGEFFNDGDENYQFPEGMRKAVDTIVDSFSKSLGCNDTLLGPCSILAFFRTSDS